MKPDNNGSAQRPFLFSQGKLLFSSSLERRIFFYLTAAMAAIGILARYGILS